MLAPLPERTARLGQAFLFMAKISYEKTSLSVEEQIQLLKKRNLAFDNEEQGLRTLQNVSLFRMKGYLHTLQSDKVNHLYKDGATFEQALELYRFDSDLRRLVFSSIEQIEVSVRTRLSERMTNATNHFWYIEPSNFKDTCTHAELLKSIYRELHRSDDEQIVKFFNSYTNQWPPSWMAMEICSFGTLSLLYKHLNAGICKRDIANYYGLRDTVFESWIHSLVYVRNICGHHSRLWNRNMRIQPMIPKKCSYPFVTQQVRTNKIYYIFCIVKYLLNVINPQNNLTTQINSLFVDYPDISKSAMNFPLHWEEETLFTNI